MAKAILGQNGQLFLGDDTNDSVSQFTGRVTYDESAILGWSAYHQDRASLSSEMGCNGAFLIAPNKEAVYTEDHPVAKQAAFIVQRYIAKFPYVIYPRAVLRTARDHCPTYPATDSHWTDWGAYIAAAEAITALGLSAPRLDLSYFGHDPVFYGDLGSKMDPKISAPTVVFRPKERKARLIFDNQIHNHGRIWVFDNLTPAFDAKLLIFGDSFSVQMSRILATWFRSVTYVHTIPLDASIVRRVKPDYFLCQVAERFLIKAPVPVEAFSLRGVIKRKLRDFDPLTRKRLEDMQAVYWPEF